MENKMSFLSKKLFLILCVVGLMHERVALSASFVSRGARILGSVLKDEVVMEKMAACIAMGVCVASAVLPGSTIIQYIREKKIERAKLLVQRAKFLAQYDDVAKVDPELYEAFCSIAKDQDIDPSKIALCMQKQGAKWDHPLDSAAAYFHPGYDTIVLKRKEFQEKQRRKAFTIFLLTHELEHYRQKEKYPGSFDQGVCVTKLSEEAEKYQRVKKEHWADNAATDYLNCSGCLKEIGISHGWSYKPQDTSYGFFTTKTGYFSKKDLQPYFDRASAENALCPAHKKIKVEHLAKEGQVPNFWPMKFGKINNLQKFGLLTQKELDKLMQTRTNFFEAHMEIEHFLGLQPDLPLKDYLPERPDHKVENRESQTHQSGRCVA